MFESLRGQGGAECTSKDNGSLGLLMSSSTVPTVHGSIFLQGTAKQIRFLMVNCCNTTSGAITASHSWGVEVELRCR